MTSGKHHFIAVAPFVKRKQNASPKFSFFGPFYGQMYSAEAEGQFMVIAVYTYYGDKNYFFKHFGLGALAFGEAFRSVWIAGNEQVLTLPHHYFPVHLLLLVKWLGNTLFNTALYMQRKYKKTKTPRKTKKTTTY